MVATLLDAYSRIEAFCCCTGLVLKAWGCGQIAMKTEVTFSRVFRILTHWLHTVPCSAGRCKDETV